MKKVLVPGFLFLCLISCRKPETDMDKYAGHYRLTGTAHSWGHLDTIGPRPPVLIDTIVEIAAYNATTLTILGYALPHDVNRSGSDVNVYRWEGNPYNYKSLYFKKPFNDTAYYSSQGGGLGAGGSTNLRGKKIY